MTQEGEYTDRVARRLDALERFEVKTRQDTVQTKTELLRLEYDVKQEMESLRVELGLLQKEVGTTVERVKRTVDDFKKVVKRGDFLRIQSKIDASSYEKRVTREQLKQLISESF